MSDRITQKHLNSIVAYLNKITGFENKQLWTKDEQGRNVATVGMFYMSGGYRGTSIYRMTTDIGGVCDVFSGHMTKRDLYNRIRAYIKALEDVKYNEITIKGGV